MKRKPDCHQSQSNTADTANKFSTKFKLPLKYDKRWRLNFIYKPKIETFAAYDATGKLVFFLNFFLNNFSYCLLISRKFTQV